MIYEYDDFPPFLVFKRLGTYYLKSRQFRLFGYNRFTKLVSIIIYIYIS